ncbi:MAG: tripartite tricarboxylate transporter substrate binding protein [Achromobacter sp.]|uniref:Bug family tripartite tricarboxylate transporter substrate binding protein n=1 Tax=Achromobacter sp. TaxID=134375 RepID=UPI00258CBB3C|nr:tripartite tricarboxylate transporter substrate binding protein [Achromobacter sp.]MCW0211246.1 tripartite tricarboxylate transporter substrate binding protein [Achromobacter sp.]
MTTLKGLLAAVLSLAVVGTASGADAYPDKPVRLYVGFAPGGATDLLARLFARKLGERFNQTFIVENRPGAGGNIAIQALTQAPADGYTIAMAANYVAANAAMKRNPYDWERDLMPIGMVASTPNILVVPPGSSLNSVDDLIRQAKRPGNKLTFSSAGMGSSIHLAGELFKVMAGVDMTHVPYKGVSPAEVDLMAGTVDMMFGSVSTAIPLVQTKKLKALAVTGRERMKAMPDLPTIEEAGLKGYDVEAVYFMAAPARIPAPVLERLADAVADINKQPDVQEFMDRIYARPLTGGPEEARAFLKAEVRKWQGVVDATGMKVD